MPIQRRPRFSPNCGFEWCPLCFYDANDGDPQMSSASDRLEQLDGAWLDMNQFSQIYGELQQSGRGFTIEQDCYGHMRFKMDQRYPRPSFYWQWEPIALNRWDAQISERELQRSIEADREFRRNQTLSRMIRGASKATNWRQFEAAIRLVQIRVDAEIHALLGANVLAMWELVGAAKAGNRALAESTPRVEVEVERVSVVQQAIQARTV